MVHADTFERYWIILIKPLPTVNTIKELIRVISSAIGNLYFVS